MVRQDLGQGEPKENGSLHGRKERVDALIDRTHVRKCTSGSCEGTQEGSEEEHDRRSAQMEA